MESIEFHFVLLAFFLLALFWCLLEYRRPLPHPQQCIIDKELYKKLVSRINCLNDKIDMLMNVERDYVD